MPNMSYCQFENTLPDLQDCVDTLNNKIDLGEPLSTLSKIEQNKAQAMYEACETYIQLMDELKYQNEN